MSPRKRRDPAEVARQTMKKNERRRGFLEYIQTNDLPKNELSAHRYSYSLGMGVAEKDKLVHELLEGMRFEELMTRGKVKE